MCMHMVRKSKVETSPHYKEIVELLVAGYSGRHVSDYLQNQYDEKITHTTLNKYKKDNLNVKAEVRKKILEKEKEKKKKESQKKSKEAAKDIIEQEADKEIQAKETLNIAADYRYNDIKKLDDLISQAESINVNLDNMNPNEEKYDPYKEQNLKINMKKIGLQAMRLKYELIDEDEVDVNIHDDRIIGLVESIEKSRQKYLKETEEQ